MQVSNNIEPLSCMGKWQKQVLEKSCKNESVKNLSYELMKKFISEMKEEARWKNWKVCIGLELRRWKIFKEITPHLFIQVIVGRGYKIQYLQTLASKLRDPFLVDCFYGNDPDYQVRENKRIQADSDVSRGYLKDIAYSTIREVADLIEMNASWKIMGDGLGFNFSECCQFSDSIEMFKKWRQISPDGTLSRIYFEAERLGFTDVCTYLDQIPMQKISAMKARDSHAFNLESRLVTIFDLERLEKICGAKVDWAAISHLLFKSFDSKVEDIWVSGDVTLAQLKKAFNVRHKEFLTCFEQFMTEGFEPRSLKDVTYNQVAFLAESISCDSTMTEAQFSELLNKKTGRVHQLLCVYWQLNRTLDLTQFFNKIFDLILPAHPTTARLLASAYDLILPQRHYGGKAPLLSQETT